MFESLAHWVAFITDNKGVFSFFMRVLFLLGLYLVYLFLALFLHRKDRKELERVAVSKGIDVLFRYSWKGVELKISHPKTKEK